MKLNSAMLMVHLYIFYLVLEKSIGYNKDFFKKLAKYCLRF